MKFPPKLYHVKFLLVNNLKDETTLQHLTLTSVVWVTGTTSIELQKNNLLSSELPAAGAGHDS